MTCFHPVKGYRSRDKNPTGKYPIVFNTKDGYGDLPVSLPCGKCRGCRLDRSKDWSVRCMHEAQGWEANCFLTLTYDDKFLPSDFSIDVRTLQKFLKRLRKSLSQKIRFFACGEYGEDDPSPFEGNRPHYHLLVYNYRPTDLQLFSKKNGNYLYTSNQLTKLWPFGFSTVGDLTAQSAAYVARYTMKKIGGDQAAAHYTRMHPLSGNLVRVKPEFSTQSRRPGIGHNWFEQFKSDVYPSDFVIVDGKPQAVPRYYHRKLAEEEQRDVKIRKIKHARKNRSDNTPDRLKVREAVLAARTSLLKRSLK